MAGKYFPRFVRLFEKETGIDFRYIQTGRDGWVYVPPEVGIESHLDGRLRLLGACGFCPDEKVAGGWWICPWHKIEESSVIAITLSDTGLKRFAFLEGDEKNRRHLFYVDTVTSGSKTGFPQLHGQFLKEMFADSVSGEDAGGSVIYYPSDLRIQGFHQLTPEENLVAVTYLSEIAEVL